MSQNKYMHPRNIYRNPPNFKELAISYPEFRKYVKQSVSGKVSLDFKDQAALRALTTTLLNKDFGLQVEIPADRLVPTLPLRLNYLLWIEDVMQLISTSKEKQIKGVDIGTGASCIYPLLAAKTNQWKMLASEVDGKSVEYAKKNVESNKLQDLITVKQVEADTILKGVLDPEERYDFTMCNPPFFSNEKEADSTSKSRSDSRPPPHNVKTGTVGEVVVEGGERAFILQMIQESAELQNRVKVFSTMLGLKSSLKQLRAELEKVGVAKSILTEFCQGHTTRWGLAWTFIPGLSLESIPKNKKKKKDKPPMTYMVPEPEDLALYTVSTVTDKLKQLLMLLQIKHKDMKRNKYSQVLEISAHSNTWSHQRQKKRKQKMQDLTPELEPADETHDSKRMKSEENDTSEFKVGESILQDSGAPLQAPASKDSGTDGESSRALAEGPVCENEDQLSREPCLLKAVVSVGKTDDKINIEMAYLEGSAGKEAMHQVMQYIKNNFKIVNDAGNLNKTGLESYKE